MTGYDAAGRATGGKTTIPSAEGALAGVYEYSTSYTLTGKVASETIPAAGGLAKEVVTHDYDARGFPIKSTAENRQTGGTFSYVSGTEYSAFGEVTAVIRGAALSPRNIVTTNHYEPRTRRLLRTAVDRETATASVVADIHYGYDDAGRIRRVADVAPNGSPTRSAPRGTPGHSRRSLACPI